MNMLTTEQSKALLQTLKTRFEKNMHRHKACSWDDVQVKLEAAPNKIWSLSEMERTGGEPDVVGMDTATGAFIFYDCTPETPKGRRSICYDQAALDSRKEYKPAYSACGMASTMGIELLTEEEYRAFQEVEAVDLKTSSWVAVPAEVRKLGGALFCDRRYGMVFVYHNGAESYYAGRGFRGSLRVL